MRQNKRRTAFILAAGLGTRLRELTSDRPKALVELNGRPLLEIIIDNLISQEFNHLIVNVHHFGDMIIDFLSKEKYNDIDIEISDERGFLYDTGGAILKALPLMKDSEAVLIHNVDIISDIDFKSIHDDFTKSPDVVWLITQNRNNKRKIVFDKDDNFLGRFNTETKEFDGEIEYNDEMKTLSFSGLHLIKPEAFSEQELRKCYVFDLYKEISKKNTIKSRFIEPKYWFDLGTQEQLKEASSWLLSAR